MNGTSETTFEPLATTSRAMVVQVLYNMSDRPRVYAQKAFDDVVEGQWYYDAVNWAKAVGVCNGTSETEFSPNDPVTREQLAAFLYRYAVLCGYTCIASGDLSGLATATEFPITRASRSSGPSVPVSSTVPPRPPLSPAATPPAPKSQPCSAAS